MANLEQLVEAWLKDVKRKMILLIFFCLTHRKFWSFTGCIK